MYKTLITLVLSLILSLPALTAETKPYVTRESYYFIYIKEVTDQLMNVATDLLTLAKKNTSYSLLNFEYREEQPLEVEAYNRERHFGGWVKNQKADGGCYSTRVKVLIRDSKKPVVFKKDDPCTIAEGAWVDPYAGSKITNPLDIQIDHVVPLKDAYISGAYNWTDQQRCFYGNYLGYRKHLLSVDGQENTKKSDQTPVDYIPPKKDYLCTYARDWLKIKAFWGLTFTEEEKNKLAQIINDNNCDQSQFVITKKELQAQYSFYENNIKICDGFQSSAIRAKSKLKESLK